MKGKLFFLVMLLCISNLLFVSASSWEGIASRSRYGELPSSGYYAASNSFERNTLIKVVNKTTGKETTVLVTDRLDNPGLFLLLSEDAAEDIGIQQNQIVRVEVSIAQSEVGSIAGMIDEPAFHPDPEINPTAAIRDIDPEIEASIEGEEAVVDETSQEESSPPEEVLLEMSEVALAPKEPIYEFEQPEAPVEPKVKEKPKGEEEPEATEATSSEEEKKEEEARFLGTEHLSQMSESKFMPIGMLPLPEKPEPSVSDGGVAESTLPTINAIEPESREEPRLVELSTPFEPVLPEITKKVEAETVLEGFDALDLRQAPEEQSIEVPGIDSPSEPERPDRELKPNTVALEPMPMMDVEEVEIPDALSLPAEPLEEEKAAIVKETEKPAEEADAEETPPKENVKPEVEETPKVAMLPELVAAPEIPSDLEEAIPAEAVEQPELPPTEEQPKEATALPEAEAPEIAEPTEEHEAPEKPSEPQAIEKPKTEEEVVTEIPEIETVSPPQAVEPPTGPIASGEDTPVEVLPTPDIAIAPDIAEVPGAPTTQEPSGFLPTPDDMPASRSEPEVHEVPEVAMVEEEKTTETRPDIFPKDATIVFTPAEKRPPKPEEIPEPADKPEREPAQPDVDTEKQQPQKKNVSPSAEKAETTTASGRTPDERARATETAETVATAALDFPTTSNLESNSYYIQLASYSETARVKELMRTLSPTYPVTVYTPDMAAAQRLYKVLLGPLNQDESGSMLFTFRSNGYSDAFVRKGE